MQSECESESEEIPVWGMELRDASRVLGMRLKTSASVGLVAAIIKYGAIPIIIGMAGDVIDV
jgi:hypothetical protein